MDDKSSSIQTVEIIKQPGQTLGFYIREGNGLDRSTGVFISRIAPGSVVAQNGLLRVGDEILSINAVDVQNMRLDDVVILMSIPKRLVLTIRIQKPCCQNATCPNLAGLTARMEDGSSCRQQPVVVLKSGFSQSFGEDRSPDELTMGGMAGGDAESGYRRLVQSYLKRYGEIKDDKNSALLVGEDSGDSGLSSDNSGLSRPQDSQQQQQRSPSYAYSTAAASLSAAGMVGGGIYQQAGHHDQSMYPVDINYDERGTPQRSPRGTMSRSSDCAPPMPAPMVGRSNRTGIDYASDTDVNYQPVGSAPMERFLSRYNSGWSGGPGSGPAPRREGMLGRRQTVDMMTRPNGSVRMFNGADQYSSDSEVLTNQGPQRPGYGRQMSLSGVMGSGYSGEDRYHSLPHTSYPEDINDYVQQSLRLVRQKNQQSVHNYPGYGDSLSGNFSDLSLSSHPSQRSGYNRPFTSSDYVSWMTGAGTAPPVGSQSRSRASSGNPPTVGYRLTRKLSTDSLLDYKTYQMDEPQSGTALSLLDHQQPRITDNKKPSRRNPSPGFSQSVGSGNHMGSYPSNTMTLSRAQHFARDRSSGKASGPSAGLPAAPTFSSNASSSSRIRNLQLSRVPLKIHTETFQPIQSDGLSAAVTTDKSGDPDNDCRGALLARVYCGHGLKSSRTALRDLYCVLDIDSINRARTMIRTGAINFDWDEEFDVDLEDGGRRLSFLIYSWDPHTRHRLCFSGALILPELIRRSGIHQRLALRLEPKGILYVELDYREPAVLYRRMPSALRDALFGVGLKELAQRERSGVPILVQRCIAEVERRGLDHVGLYRLCGSARRKRQLREELESDVLKADLSSEAVSDVNVITGVLKDFLRELPEPLCSNCLYQMLLDALSVQLPGDSEGNAQFMWSILECLPRINQDTLAFLLDHLKRVSLRCDVNKMTSRNLAVCFGPALICPSSQAEQSTQQVLKFSKHIELMNYLMDIWPENRVAGSSVSQLRQQGEAHPHQPASGDYNRGGADSLSGPAPSSGSGGDFPHHGDPQQKQQQTRSDAMEGGKPSAWENLQSSPC